MAAGVARECELNEVLSLDMGGTTAKICLIRDGVPESSRSFETARVYRDQKGSGLPLRVPLTEVTHINLSYFKRFLGSNILMEIHTLCFTAHFFKYPVDLLQLKMAELGFERTNHFKAHRRTEKP